MPVEPNPFDDEKLAKIRADQGEDPIIQYYIVRKDVPMSVGKVCAQIGHGAQMFILSYMSKKASGNEDRHIQLTDEWLSASFRKGVLCGKGKDFEKLKNELDVFVVKDAGLTEVPTGTETVMVTWPMRKSSRPKILKRLQALKELRYNENRDKT